MFCSHFCLQDTACLYQIDLRISADFKTGFSRTQPDRNCHGQKDAKEIYKPVYRLIVNNMVMRQKEVILILLLYFLSLTGSALSDVLINGTNMYLATGESSALYQEYVLSLKGVSGDGSMWLQLTDNETIVKSEIVYSYGSFVYNKTNRTIISLNVDKVYSGQSEQHLVSFFLYQFNDPEKPFPDKTIIPENTVTPGNNNPPPENRSSIDPMIWVPGIALVLILIYFVRKLW